MELHDKTLREEEYLRGKDDGYHLGKDDGCNQGYKQFSTLVNCLIADGLSEDISKVTTDKAYRDEMLKKYNI